MPNFVPFIFCKSKRLLYTFYNCVIASVFKIQIKGAFFLKLNRGKGAEFYLFNEKVSQLLAATGKKNKKNTF